ncbi:MAG TPA: gamma-glutamyl-gamma-aminobutyrate hydrolase family protein [Candidatus Coprocola pullicola]|nr:gamma-glutamyl-gamma-aminobutyrate hydrolase family protein [Candidatus Coprocola pullicola]
MKPIIGITPDYSYEAEKFMVSQHYIKAIETAGGYPMILCPNEMFPDFIDGLLLTGGGDIDPILFGEEPIAENGEISPLRDAFEWSLCQKAQEKKLPILGICRGMQLLAILNGGSIYQDIYSQTNTMIKHIQKAPRFYGTHTIEIATNSILSKIANQNSCVVNSFHHQSVKEAGKDFMVCAKSKDGLIEAIEHKTARFIIGVQWHPEMMKKDKIQMKLFEMFVKAAKER